MKYDQIALIADRDFNLRDQFNADDAEWITDAVTAKGIMRDNIGIDYASIENVAMLKFNYTAIPGIELELIRYIKGPNFLLDKRHGNLSHFGVHVDSIDGHRAQMLFGGYEVKQEVITVSHTNVPDNRRYHYVIYQHHDSAFFWKHIERLDGDVEITAAQEALNRRYHRDIF